jgi:hypothetical protein
MATPAVLRESSAPVVFAVGGVQQSRHGTKLAFAMREKEHADYWQ